MPTHEPEVLMAIRRRQPFNSRVMLDDNFSNDGQVLCCPRCDSRYLHCAGSHDADEDTHILFSCDSCGCGDGAEFELVIVEHKGNDTLIEWRKL